MKPYLWTARELLSGRLIREFIVMAAGCSKLEPADCNICGYHGVLRGHDAPIILGTQCPRCTSLPRQRLLALAIRDGALSFDDREVLHFAPNPPEPAVIDRDKPRKHVPSSYPPGKADLALDIEAIDLPDESFDTVICSHILEHVDDAKALREIYRILRPGGEVIAMVPIIEGWASTYENPSITSEQGRHTHFGQFDHIRYYGRDFRDRITAAGFELREYTGRPEDAVRYALQRGETIFIGKKPAKSIPRRASRRSA